MRRSLYASKMNSVYSVIYQIDTFIVAERWIAMHAEHFFVPLDSRLRHSFGFTIGKCANRVSASVVRARVRAILLDDDEA